MEYTLNNDSFFVTELFSPKFTENGKYNYYLIEKKGISHKQLLKRLPRDASFCGIKDRNATTKQWMSTKQNIDDINEDNLSVHFQGKSDTGLYIGTHKGNSFKVLVNINSDELAELKDFKAKKELVSNYFGEQRFSSFSNDLFELITDKKFENALKLFLCKKTKFDTDKSTAMKKIIDANWGNWKIILEHELIKDTGKKVLFDFLEKNPSNFKEAFLHAEPKSVKQLVKTMQSIRWNKLLAEETILKKPKNIFGEISKTVFPLSAIRSMKREISVEPTEFEKAFFKRTLKRKTFFIAKHFSLKKQKENMYWLTFELSRGEYATVFLKYLEAKINSIIAKQ